MLAVVAQGLSHLKGKVAFVGGATIDLYLTDPAAPPSRATDDVDCVVELTSAKDYHDLEKPLRALGFTHDQSEGAPLCRWLYCGIKVDVMPDKGSALGFTNRWYPDGLANTVAMTLPGPQEIRVFSLPYLIASKLEAFKDRGRNDYAGSSDLEDVVALLDGCPDARAQIAQAPPAVKTYLAARFASFLKEERFLDSVPGLMPGGAGRAARLLELLRELSAKGN